MKKMEKKEEGRALTPIRKCGGDGISEGGKNVALFMFRLPLILWTVS